MDLCIRFRAIMNRKNESISLRKWVDKAKNSGILLLTKFAKGIEKEFDAV